ncbi:probable ADP-ribosylation factor GTPase-activating protein AGD14 [Corylus avellana]|uniref:probable ADP-ribosylation factor GTPase-activating protein AGD14 n=1 Tax=Corylus avellana TaxID=13451 RepID=UPI00286B1257|nr:probable ADP-ribosylation factor GTPase-activating protein AGD14 [Corylus avellana]
MANRMKEDERIERIIRGLLRHPENRRCINCNSLGPQYVCTNFLTFVCTNCSGVHREFTHRVKSVSMAKFSTEEVSALQAGGNERARQIYFKDWDPQRHSYPDGSNLHRLRDFIKHVYVDRKYTGEKTDTVELPSLRLNDKESHSRKVSAYSGGSRSPHYEKRHERRHSERSSPVRRSVDGSVKYYYDERRSPRYAQENSRYGVPKRTKLVLGLVLGSSLVKILNQFPVGVLGVLLLFAGIELSMASKDMNTKEESFVMLLCTAVSLVGSSAALGFVCGIVAHLLLRLRNNLSKDD